MANLQIVIKALNQASGDLAKVKGDIKGVGDAGKDAKGGVEGFSAGLGSVLSKAALVAGAAAAVGVAIKEVYDTAKEGAELEYARTRFDNLASSIGTVSDALLGDMREATSGMMSDAELVAGAADFMALGLAKSHDEVVRLTTVAGALGMNMNQLVLTLTNQTTMRFDALGVSVDGFDAKVKALEASGLSANEAFTEAFLQQAEAQIEKVGAKADTSAGQIQIMESAFKNLGDAVKLGFANSLDGVTPKLTNMANTMTENVTIGSQMADTMEKLKAAYEAKLITTAQYDQVLADTNYFWHWGAIKAEELAIAQGALNRAIGAGEDGVITYTEAVQMGQAQLALMAAESESAATATETVADATNNADMAMRGYTESLLFKIASEGLSAEAAYDLAVAMGLVDQNTVAATEQTNVYKQMLDAKIISQSQYNLLIEDLADDIENLPEGHTLKVEDNVDDVKAHLSDLETWKVEPIPVTLSVDESGVRNYDPPTKYGTVVYQPKAQIRAVGGAVNAGNPYNWQEYGYRGEVFVPSADGFVLSRADAERALARALYGGESAVDPEAIGKAVAKALSGITGNKQGSGNVYNLTMPTSSNPADIRTAFELMEAWA